MIRKSLAIASLIVVHNAAAQTTALVGGTIIDGTGKPAIERGVVVINGRRITCVGSAAQCTIPANATRTDVTGRFITPGLVDAHVHFSQTGWVDGRPDGLPAPEIYPYGVTSRSMRANPQRWFRTYLCTGITAVYDVGGQPWTTGLPAIAAADTMAPHVRAAGPLITHAPRTNLMADDTLYTFLPMATSADVQASVAKLKAMGSSAVKVWYLAPQPARRDELDARMMEVGAAAKAAGLDLIVHSTGLREAKVALRAGAVLLVHSVEDQHVDQEFLDLLAKNRATYAPTLVVGRNATRASVAIWLGQRFPIDDPGNCVDANTVEKINNVEPLRALLSEDRRSPEAGFRRLENVGARGAIMAENIRRVFASGANVVTATDAGNPLTLHGPSIYNEMEAMQAAGISATDVVLMSTRNGAMAMGTKDFGTLEAGKLADLLVLTEDPRVNVRAFRSRTHVMRGGRMYLQSALVQRR
jgi:imidazolonepropionase-like amidohydrolase